MPDIRELKDQATKYFSKGKYEKAATVYTELCRLEPKDMQLRVRLGDAYVKGGERAQAISSYRVAAESYAREGFLPRAIAVCKLILELEPDHVATQQTLAQLYAKRSGRPLGGDNSAARPSAPTPTPAATIKPPAPATPAIELELDTSPKGFTEGVSASAPERPTAAAEASGLELDTGEAQADWKGAPAWVAPPAAPETKAVPAPASAETQPAARAAEAPAVPSQAPEAGLSLEIDLSPEELGLPLSASVPLESPAAPEPAPAPPPRPASEAPAAHGDDVMFVGEPAREPGFSLGEIDLGEPELVEVPGPTASHPEVRTVEVAPAATSEAESWWAPPESSPPTSLADLDIASVDEEAEVELLTISADQPLDAASLPEIPLFSDLSREAFIDLASRCKLVRPEPGEVVVEEGSIGTSFFVVSSGSVRVVKQRDGEGELVVARLTEGAFFGEMALISGAPRAASVVAEEETELLEISAALLADLQRRYPHVGQVLKKFCRQRLLANVMATSPLFKPFGKQERNALVERFKARDVAADDVVLHEGKLSDGLFVVMSGELEVLKRKGDDAVPLATLREGDLFGEISLLTKSAATATVVARRRSTLLRLPREAFDELISTHPQILMLVSELSDERLQIQQALEAGALDVGEDGLMLV